MNKDIKRNALNLLSFLVLMSPALSGNKERKEEKKENAQKVIALKAKNERTENDGEEESGDERQSPEELIKKIRKKEEKIEDELLIKKIETEDFICKNEIIKNNLKKKSEKEKKKIEVEEQNDLKASHQRVDNYQNLLNTEIKEKEKSFEKQKKDNTEKIIARLNSLDELKMTIEASKKEILAEDQARKNDQRRQLNDQLNGYQKRKAELDIKIALWREEQLKRK